jgi:hypothetical protein
MNPKLSSWLQTIIIVICLIITCGAISDASIVRVAVLERRVEMLEKIVKEQQNQTRAIQEGQKAILRVTARIAEALNAKN